MTPDPRLGVVLITHNRRAEILRTLGILRRQGEAAAIAVVDNGSSDGTAAAIACRFPECRLIALAANAGAAGRNHGVAALATPYIAFCDDDTWWADGALRAAADLFDRRPRLAALTGRILVGPEEREDPTSAVMAASPLADDLRLPGVVPVAGLMAGACVMRRQAYLAAGGYEPRLFLGSEERLLTLDLLTAGWRLGYAADLIVHHHPSAQRDVAGRCRLLLRNALWCAWLRRPWRSALAESRRCLTAVAPAARRQALRDSLWGLPWVLAGRRVIPPGVERQLRLLERPAP